MPAAIAASARPLGEVVYPDSDGEPMCENTAQAEWMALLFGNLDTLLPDFVAIDLLWYPVEGENFTRIGPDVMVAFGRPKGYRGSYKQWEEGGVAPQVVFEIISPSNSPREMVRKHIFYDRFGVEEYYVYDPDDNGLRVYVRRDGRLTEIDPGVRWTSPLLGVRFELSDTLELFRPDGERFQSFGELRDDLLVARRRAETERQRAETERQRAETERQRAEAECQRAETERQRADALAAKLRALGIDPDAG